APERQQARGREAGGRCGLLGGGRGGRRGADDERLVGRPGQVVGRVGVVPDELDHLVGGGGAAEDEGGDEHQRAEAPAVVAGGEVGRRRAAGPVGHPPHRVGEAAVQAV